jgi:hypothetical protein
VGGVSGLWGFCKHSQKELPAGYPMLCFASVCAPNTLNEAITKNKRTSHLMNKLKQCAPRCFFPLKGLGPQQVQAEFNKGHCKQASRLPAVEKWHLCFADRKWHLEDERRSGQPKKLTSWTQLQICFMRSHLHHVRRYWGY